VAVALGLGVVPRGGATLGHAPFPYHAASLLLHVANVMLLHRLARRWGASPLAAWLGAGLFAASRLHFPALFAATSIGELFALTFTLVALLLAGPGPRAWMALGAFALALSAKESVLLVPFAALLVAPAGTTVRERARALAPFVAGGALLGALLLASGVGSGRLAGEAYAVSLGANLAESVARLFGWTIDVRDPIPDLHATTTGVAHWLLPLIAVALTLLAVRFGRDALLRAGTAWWWLAVLPVLPLPGRTYLHYLYTPLAGVALVVAALCDRALAARAGATPGRGRQRWAVALLVLVVYAAWNDVLLSVRADLRMTSTDWPLDPVLRKSEIARRGIEDTRAALAGRRANVAILIPASISRDVNLGSGAFSANTPVKRYALEDVLDSGRSLEALVPEADSVVFVHDYEPGRAGWLLLLSLSDSHLVPLGVLPAAHASFVEAMLRSQFPRRRAGLRGQGARRPPGRCRDARAARARGRGRAALSAHRDSATRFVTVAFAWRSRSTPRRYSGAPPRSSRWSQARATSQSRLTVAARPRAPRPSPRSRARRRSAARPRAPGARPASPGPRARRPGRPQPPPYPTPRPGRRCRPRPR
jgi:hypothetical protein